MGLGKYGLYTSSADIEALQKEFDSYYNRYQAKLLSDLYQKLFASYADSFVYSFGWDVKPAKEEKMENKITDWVVRNNVGSVCSWHANKADAVKAAEKNAAGNPTHKYFVCRVEPVSMSVTNNVTTKDL